MTSYDYLIVGSQPSRDRSGQTYRLSVQRVRKQLEHLQLIADPAAGTCLKGGAVLLLKKNSKGNQEDDRCVLEFGPIFLK